MFVSLSVNIIKDDTLLNEEKSSSVNVIEVNFLNEIESWGGINKKIKRGKYLIARPDIEELYKRPKYTKGTPLLVNGNALPPVKLDGKHIIIKNTCPFDATM